jgi:hypothetical protein
MSMLHSISSPVRARLSSLRDRPELNLIIIYFRECGTFKDHPFQAYKIVHTFLLLLFKYYSEMLYKRIVSAASEVILKDM